MDVEISAVVATYNRAAYLRKALQSLADQTLSQDRYEIVVVDNGSQDETRQVCAEFHDMLNLRYLYEPVSGVSRARNTGCRSARGDYVAFMDDDCVATPGWLTAILGVFTDCQPKPGIVGGPIEGIWEAPRPDWLPDPMLGMLGIVDWGPTRKILTDRSWLPFGNMAMPRDLWQRVGGAREDLDRQGSKLRANGENYVGQQVKLLGYNLVYDPEVTMYHHVHASRLNQDYLKRWYHWSGLSDATMYNIGSHLGPLQRVRVAAGTLAHVLPWAVLMALDPRPAGRFRRRCQVHWALGLVTGLFRPREQG
jgi:glucosyl-dolichyl phosphate glucuronosyltransferase